MKQQFRILNIPVSIVLRNDRKKNLVMDIQFCAYSEREWMFKSLT